MTTCWTCGSPVENFSFNCAACRNIDGLGELMQQVAASDSAQLAHIQIAGFARLQSTLKQGFNMLATVMEWGFTEISWQIQQQTDTLKSIDRTLAAPTLTQANEYRLMADELKRRGVLDEAEDFYSRSLALNRLDYRGYICLAETLLRRGSYVRALEILERSLPHAPRSKEDASGIEDWRSHSLRLMGRVHFCLGNVESAVTTLETAVALSPRYAEALYDYVSAGAQNRPARGA